MQYPLSWVSRSVLAVGPAPRTRDEIRYIVNKGIKAVVCLCSEEEADAVPCISEYLSFKRCQLPDHKTSVVPTAEQLIEAYAILSKSMLIGPTLVHCLAGVERSPLLCLMWIRLNKKMSTTRALSYLKSVHSLTNPLPDQLARVNEAVRILELG